MGKLRDLNSQAIIPLRASHRLGRDPGSDTVFTDLKVSIDHARIQWRGDRWVLRDLGSNNGTVVGGRRISGIQVQLRPGTRIELGDPSTALEFVSGEPPEPFAIRSDGRVVEGRDGELYLPQIEAFQAVILPDDGATWSMTLGGEIVAVLDRDRVRVGGSYWKLSLSRAPQETSIGEGGRYSVRDTHLRFEVSVDEEHTQLYALVKGAEINLGRFAHNYSLLTLARRFVEDYKSGMPEDACGWWDRQALAQGLRIESGTLNVHLHRSKLSLQRLEWRDPEALIESRGRKQIRIGVRDVEIIRVGVP